MPRAIVSPSILASDFGQLTAECTRMIKGGAEWLHMDVMDGHFVPNITIGTLSRGINAFPFLTAVPAYRSTSHLMRDPPSRSSDSYLWPHREQWVNDIADAGGALYCFHIEATPNPLSLISAIHARNMRAGVAISPDTASTAITDEIGNASDMLLVMTVYPGRGGQKFIERCVPKVADLRARFPHKDIEVDGGVGPKTVDVCAEAGSNVVVAGSAIFSADNPEQVIATLKHSVNTALAKGAATSDAQ
ncbi:hypothetical protein AX15_001772 [Amanita polypyramis BW_CC]|nr:hypothetical protein AX15_001772 [Amanita polypyramis BW_CC]